jgi:ribosomal protein S18 acetylase RimI-like enzyme
MVMMRKISQLTIEETARAAELVISNRQYRQHFFPGCDSVGQIGEALHTLGQDWYVIDGENICAIFKLETSRTVNKVACLCIDPRSVDEVASKMSSLFPATSMTILAPSELATALSRLGFESRGVEVGLSKVPQESRTMQLLPLSIPVEKDISELSRVMYESYQENKWAENKYPDAAVAERSLRSLISAKDRSFLRDSSFMSKAGDKIVSVCLIKGEYVGASVAELFTHPLYRARGLATTELTVCMNSLARKRIRLLRISVDERNEVIIRLLSKLGFIEDIRTTILTKRAD